MCEDCKDPMAWAIEEQFGRDVLLIPLAKSYDKAPSVEGWEPFWTNIDASLNETDGYAKVVKYRQPTPTFFVCAYNAHREYMGPEEGGWGHEFRDLINSVSMVTGDRRQAERICRALNRLARGNGVAPGPYQWGTNGIVFSIDRYIGEHDTKYDGPVHYC